MVRVRVRFLQEYYLLARKHEIELDLEGENPTVRDLIHRLPENIRKRLLDENGEVRPPNEILVNGRSIAVFNGLDTRLREGDTVIVMPRPLFVV